MQDHASAHDQDAVRDAELRHDARLFDVTLQRLALLRATPWPAPSMMMIDSTPSGPSREDGAGRTRRCG